ncbi:Hypothetical predicted protein [Olea europaea subsp. europaea]|uniref:Uncharacterized protein n=1 Tax=Olea europaea subsp. europaea TaxID=158383 RepID=A0A8S0PH14_OLEEU|nr:Hypothetical predicted protein [Olea europaea subsp. europaea]
MANIKGDGDIDSDGVIVGGDETSEQHCTKPCIAIDEASQRIYAMSRVEAARRVGEASLLQHRLITPA